MNGGDADAGGAQVNPSYTPSSTPGLRPDSSATQDTELDTVLTISHDQSSPDAPTQPNPQPLTTPSTTGIPTSPTPPLSSSAYAPVSQAQYTPPVPQSSQSADQLISQTFAPSAPLGQPISMAPPMPQSAQYAQPLPSSPFPPQPPTTQAPTQPTYSDNGDIIIGSPTPQKSKKGLITILICLAALIIVVVAVLVATNIIGSATTSPTTSSSSDGGLHTKEEIYSTLFNFNFQYYSAILGNYNNTIGLIPSPRLSENDIILPAENIIPDLTTEVDEAIQAYNDISPIVPDTLRDGDKTIDIKSTKEAIVASMQAMQQNLSVINDFYNAYYYPLLQTPRPSTCDKTPEMLALEQGPTLMVATQYYSLYCQAVTFLSQSDDYTLLSQETAAQATDAANSLSLLLVNVPSAQKQIDALFTELTR